MKSVLPRGRVLLEQRFRNIVLYMKLPAIVPPISNLEILALAEELNHLARRMKMTRHAMYKWSPLTCRAVWRLCELAVHYGLRLSITDAMPPIVTIAFGVSTLNGGVYHILELG